MSRFLAIDFETANPMADSACAVGLVRVEDGVVVDRTAYLINPHYTDFRFRSIHGISREDVADAPDFRAAWPEIERAFDDVDFVAAHNARFDRGVLAACCDVWLLPMPDLPFVCTVRLARAVWNLRPTGLKHCARFLCVPLNHHDALSDANACAEIVMAAQIEGWRFSPDDPCALPNPLSLRQYPP